MLRLDPADLASAFGHAVGETAVEPLDELRRVHSITGGVFRIRAADESLVVKVVRRSTAFTPDGLWGGADDVGHRNYWKREWLAFDSGLLAALPGDLRAPRTRLTTQPSDDECWVWMDEVHGRTGSALLPDDFDDIAYALGTTQGAYVAGNAPLPSYEWLSRDWLAGWVQLSGPFVDVVAEGERWRDERLAPLVPLRSRTLALWEARSRLLEIADSAPPTLVHWDFWPTNLYVDGAGPVAIDWSQVGIAGLAHDLDQLILDTIWMHIRPDDDVRDLERRVLAGYRAGLLTAGVEVTERELFRWYAAAAAARYAWLVGAWPRIVADPDAIADQERRMGRALEAIVATKARVIERALELGEGLIESSA